MKSVGLLGMGIGFQRSWLGVGGVSLNGPVLAQDGARLQSLPREGSAVAARPERDSAA